MSDGPKAGPRKPSRLAALCLDHGARELWTADRDFSRFPRLRTRNPLVAS
jgi:predicted nucleic acid-binding protein